MFYYLFILDVNFLFGRWHSIYSEKGLYYFNLSNKILIISSIFLFHFIPFIFNLLNYENTKSFTKYEYILLFIFFIILIYFFDYSSEFSGGGIFFQLSNFLFKNNYLFYFFFIFCDLISFLFQKFIFQIFIDFVNDIFKCSK